MVAFGLWLAAKAKWLLGLLKDLADWLLAHPTFAVVLVLIMHVGMHQLVIDPNLRDRAAKWQAASERWEDAAVAWQDAHGRLQGRVVQARAQAAELDRANMVRVEREQIAVIERTADDFQMRVADRDAALERLRIDLDLAHATRSDGSGGAADVSAALGARCRAFGAADCDALLAALPDLLSEAEENTAKLIGLQDYVRGLMLVDFSGAAQ